MKKKSFAFMLLFCLFLAFNVHAGTGLKNSQEVYKLNDQNYNFSIRAGSGFLTGSANTLVYKEDFKGGFSEDYLSKLNWRIDKLHLGNMGFSLQKEWITIHGDAWLNMGSGDGTMDDYDWLMPGPEWSGWSHHENTAITEAQIFDINCEFLIPPLSGKHFVLSVVMGYKYEVFSWEALGGSYIYSGYSFRNSPGAFEPGELVISYKLKYKTPYIGLGFSSNYSNFEITGRIIGSRLVSAEGEDIHHLRNMEVIDQSEDGNMYSFHLAATVAFFKNYSLELSYQYTSYEKMRGDSTYKNVVNGEVIQTTYPNSVGMEFETSLVALIFSYTF